jgi:2-polyprenyl-6-methoxyphenol hydroxylase-like FAD-dependent oxidoreductase
LVATRQAHEQLLDSYEAERYPVAKTVLRGSERGFALEITSNPLARWIRTNIATRLVGPLTRLSPVRSAIFNLFYQRVD